MHYEEFRPIPPLGAVVERLWTLAGHADDLGGHDQPVLPDGRPELIVHLGDPFDRIDAAGRHDRQPAILFAGQLTSQLTLRPAGRIRVVGVRFHPFGASALGVGPLHELSGLTIGVADISAPISRALGQVRSATDDPRTAVALVQQLLIERLDPARVDDRVRSAVEAIGRRRGQVSVDRLARDLSCTRRHLERRFLATVGVGPKRLARIARFQHALRLLEQDPSARRGTATAAACGYADQAHFIRDFRTLAGCAPGEHLLRQGLLTGFFAGDDRYGG
jgi:AraC-like DNA-binding protein